MILTCKTSQKCSPRYAAQIRTVLAAACCIAFAAAMLTALHFGQAVFLLPAAVAAASLVVLTVLPDMYASGITYTRHRDWLMIEKGLLWRQTVLVVRCQIQYIRLRRTPLDRIFRLSSLVIMTSGGRVLLQGLDPVEAGRLQRLLERG